MIISFSEFEFNSNTELVLGTFLISSKPFINVNFVGHCDTEIVLNWKSHTSSNSNMITNYSINFSWSTIWKLHSGSVLNPKWKTLESFSCTFLLCILMCIILDFNDVLLIEGISTPSKTNVSLEAVRSKPCGTPFLILPGQNTLSWLKRFIVNINDSRGSNMNIFLINEIVVDFKSMLFLWICIELKTNVWMNWAKFKSSSLNT